MSNDLLTMGIFFTGISIGSLSPYKWMWLIAILIASFFIIIDMIFTIKDRRRGKDE